MIAYVDCSIVLRVVLGQEGKLREWNEIDLGVSSALVEVECLRTLDRFRLANGLSDREVASRRAAIFRILEEIEIVELTRTVLSHAAHPTPVALGTLDAIHLATAMLWRQHSGESMALATHDRNLALAAESMGFEVLGS